MLAQEAVDILPEETAGELEARLGPLGAKLAMDVIDRMARGEVIEGVKQDPSLVAKAPKLTKEHGLIDWTRTAVEVCNQIRAMQPWPTAYTFLHDDGHAPLRLIVSKAHFGIMLPAGIPGPCVPRPGAVFALPERGSLLVECGSDYVFIDELQPAGKRRMSAADFLRGHLLSAGAYLGGG
jgi:methionyl-tRNA formyltransferase